MHAQFGVLDPARGAQVGQHRGECFQLLRPATTSVRTGVRMDTLAPDLAPRMAAIAADATALLQLRRWLASRYNWHPT